jgi:hypothetical protein
MTAICQFALSTIWPTSSERALSATGHSDRPFGQNCQMPVMLPCGQQPSRSINRGGLKRRSEYPLVVGGSPRQTEFRWVSKSR